MDLVSSVRRTRASRRVAQRVALVALAATAVSTVGCSRDASDASRVSGVPVAAYPVTGPIDILGPDGRGVDGDLSSPAGVLDEDLTRAIEKALTLDRKAAAALGARFTWEAATDQFLGAVENAAGQSEAAQKLEPA